MVIFKSKQKKFEGDYKSNYVVKDYMLLKVLNTHMWKLVQSLVGNVMLIISPLNRVESMHLLSRCGNI